ncbi:L,D-transpeptidase family protein [Halovulum dunhuangense]|uniref:L,D-transpeptidase family protein n=1 Tax=Halovulum dunhuangense TaxID=1505036 RepID=A0A849KW58_9RHOB|nr:L,D-transpeptidase family protein [Halovulum dunhuangense]NNU79405.1 L,D-transpeptidase family protein [Halovulum dunhuangense]
MTGPSATRRSLVLGLGALGLSACAGRDYSTLSRADHVYVLKEERRLYLMQSGKQIREFAIDLGFAPQGHKNLSGDGRTPEGEYFIDRKNPRSAYYLSLGINYPNQQDMEIARALNVDPGGDIFIHGEPNGFRGRLQRDWTAGCIAVRNPEVEEIYARVPMGTPVTILA